jgi:hypothetical protein
MKVKKLIKLLKKQDPDRLVVLSTDGEGNSYSPVSDMSTGGYRAENTWSGEVGPEEFTDEMKEAGYYDEDDVYNGKDDVPALVLWPIN